MAALSSIKTRVVATAGGRISLLEAGAGSPLLLLHGIGSGAASWGAQLEGLSGAAHVIAWNAPGYGESQPFAPQAPRVGDYAKSIADLLDALGVECCDIVGHSLGALMAGRFARDYSSRVRSLTLAGCAIGHARLDAGERQRLLDSRIGDVEQLGARGMAEKRGPRLLSSQASEAMRRQVIDTMASVDSQGYAQAARMLSQGDMLDDLAHLRDDLPVQFIYGSADVITPPAANLRAAAALPRAPVHVLEGAGHALYLEQADAFNALIAAFLGVRP